MTESSNWRVFSTTPGRSSGADAANGGPRPLVVRNYERTVRRAEAEAQRARARLAAVCNGIS